LTPEAIGRKRPKVQVGLHTAKQGEAVSYHRCLRLFPSGTRGSPYFVGMVRP